MAKAAAAGRLRKELGKIMREPPEFMRADGVQRYRRLFVEVPGTKGGPRAFYDTLMAHLEAAGCVRGRVDRCTVYMYVRSPLLALGNYSRDDTVIRYG